MIEPFSNLSLFADLEEVEVASEEASAVKKEEGLEWAVEVALDLHLHETYHYLVPEALRGRACPGMRVLVPVGGRRLTGYLLRYSPPPEEIQLREIVDLLDDEPLFDEKMLELFEFAANYLFYPLGEVIRGALPTGINVESKLIVKLTETGRAASSSGLVRGPRGVLLEALVEVGELPATHLLEFSTAGRYYHLRELEKDGFVELLSTLTKPRASMKKARVYRVVAGVSLARRQSLLKRSQRQREVFELIEELGEVFGVGLREVLGDVSGALRGLLKKGLIDCEEREVGSDPFFTSNLQIAERPTLTLRQERVIEAILPGLEARQFQPYLLHGVTGSGKTEVYIRLIERAIAMGRQAIVLVPEISLTPQFVANFRARLGDNMTVLHSRLNERERLSQWWRIQRGEVPLVIGVRSAIFAPFPNLGVIIVDEEQENSYKQEGRFPYHARSLALVRGKISSATVVLGSATPGLESYYNAIQGKWGYLEMPERIEGRLLPAMEIVDLRQVAQRAGGVFSPQLIEHIRQTFAQKEQCILFLNRRGYHSSFLCSSCGYTFKCVHCSVSLTHHRNQGLLLCHYCGYAEVLPRTCPQCQSEELERLGLGTEKIEEIVSGLFPEARVERMDRDTTSRKGSLEGLLERFASHQTDLLIGTQMLAKGHDFPNVTLVGVLMADMGLNLPDFRSAERSFQLLTQVAGRAGRGVKPGRVVIQTFNPNHPSIQYALEHDYLGFYRSEIPIRRELGYPPFGWLVSIRFEGMDPELTRHVAEEIGKAAANRLQSRRFPGIVFLGPAPAPVERIKRRFRWQILFKGAERKTLHALIWEIAREEVPCFSRNGVKIAIDADPVQML